MRNPSRRNFIPFSYISVIKSCLRKIKRRGVTEPLNAYLCPYFGKTIYFQYLCNSIGLCWRRRVWCDKYFMHCLSISFRIDIKTLRPIRHRYLEGVQILWVEILASDPMSWQTLLLLQILTVPMIPVCYTTIC